MHITIVSDHPETLDGLETYFRRAGVATRSTRNIGRVSELTATSSAAVVIFPDDFDADTVAAALVELRSQKPRALLVLVTRDSKRFEKLAKSDGAAALVVSKPVWGWTILEAIREQLSFRRLEGRNS